MRSIMSILQEVWEISHQKNMQKIEHDISMLKVQIQDLTSQQRNADSCSKEIVNKYNEIYDMRKMLDILESYTFEDFLADQAFDKLKE